MSIGYNIRNRRERLEMEQQELAARIGVTPAAISRIESGKRMPKLENLGKIAKALNCKPEDLLKERDQCDNRTA